MLSSFKEAANHCVDAAFIAEATPRFESLAAIAAHMRVAIDVFDARAHVHSILREDAFHQERTPVSPEDNLAYLKDNFLRVVNELSAKLDLLDAAEPAAKVLSFPDGHAKAPQAHAA